ncbi:MAG: ATP-grasp domain-containing protein [Candidatus Tyrphobacter sp.]
MRIMISSGGTVTAQSVIKALREDGRATFIAIADCDSINATKSFVDEFVPVPPADDPSFTRACLDAVRRLDIGLFIPIIVEREFLPIDAAREEFERSGCRVVVPERKIILSVGDKLAFARLLERLGIRCPATVRYARQATPDVGFPAYLKPRMGSGSVGASRIESSAALHEAARGRRGLIVQEAIEGREFTVDCFAAERGRCVAAVPRERIAIKAGVSVKGRTCHDARIEGIAADLVERTGITGPANIQGILRQDGSFLVVEMNPRFSGTLALTTAAGINFCALLLDHFEGKPIPDLRGHHRAGVTMARYWSEVFEEYDGVTWSGTPIGEPRPRSRARERFNSGPIA